MEAQQIISDLRARGIQITPNAGRLIVQPASRLTDFDRAAIRRHKSILLLLLDADWDGLVVALRATLLKVEMIAASASEAQRARIADLVAEDGSAISILMLRGEGKGVRVACADLERGVRDIASGRGQGFENKQ